MAGSLSEISVINGKKFMKKKLIMAAVALGLTMSPAQALKLPKGAKKVPNSDAVSIFVNRKLNLTIYNRKTGKKSGSGTVHHRADGVKAINITINGKRIRKNLKWSMKNGRFCADSLALGKPVCGTGGTLYKLKGVCYNSRDGRMVGSKFKC